MLTLKLVIPLLVSCLFSLAGHAQNNRPLSFYKVDGLSQNTVFTIFQDQQGFLWLGTGDGLNRYDGKGVVVYKPSARNTAGFITGRVIRTKLFEDEDQKIWLSTERGIQYLDKKTNRFHYLLPFNDSLHYADGSLFPIGKTNETIWFGKTMSGVLSYHIRTKTCAFFPFPKLRGRDNDFLGDQAVMDLQGNIWLQQPSGLYRFETATKQWRTFLKGKNIRKLCINKETLLAESTDSLYVMDTKRFSICSASKAYPGQVVRSMATDAFGQVWAGDLSGNIYRLHPENNSMILAGNINPDKQNIYPVYALYFDRSGILWVGTDGMGLMKADLKKSNFSQYPATTAPVKDKIFVKSIYEDEKGQIWIGTFGQGILILNKDDLTVQSIKLTDNHNRHKSGDMVNFIQEDDDHNIWVGFGNSLYYRSPGSRAFVRFNLPVTDENGRLVITALKKYNSNWLVSTTLGSFELSIRKPVDQSTVSFNPNFGNYTFFYQKSADTNIIGFNEGGLVKSYRNDPLWKNKLFLQNKIGVKCMYRDSARKLLWIGTDKGLMAYNPLSEAYILYTEENGLANGYVYGILESGGKLWLSTNGGLSEVTLTDNGKTFPTISCKNYSKKDGLQDNEFNSGAYLKGKDGCLYFGGIAGLNWFYPSDITEDAQVKQLVITEMTVNGKDADTSVSAGYLEKLDLSYEKNNLYFQFRGLEFSNPDNIHYAYMLSGWDNNWIYSRTNNEVRYNNLPPGNYTFRVKASYNDTDWSNEATPVYIVISPPFWRTWWFYLAVGTLLILSIIQVTKLAAQRKLKIEIEKLERQKALDEERMRISQEMHDDIGAGLTQISLISEAANQHARTGKDIQPELKDISDTSRQLVDNIGEIIWALNPKNRTLDILLIHLREQLNKLLEYTPINSSLRFPNMVTSIELNNKQRRNILLVAKEIVHNAVKHSKANNLQVNIHEMNHTLFIDITDDGNGFDPEHTTSGNGLRNIRQRINEINGQIQITAASGKGSRFNITIPLS